MQKTAKKLDEVLGKTLAHALILRTFFHLQQLTQPKFIVRVFIIINEKYDILQNLWNKTMELFPQV